LRGYSFLDALSDLHKTDYILEATLRILGTRLRATALCRLPVLERRRYRRLPRGWADGVTVRNASGHWMSTQRDWIKAVGRTDIDCGERRVIREHVL